MYIGGTNSYLNFSQNKDVLSGAKVFFFTSFSFFPYQVKLQFGQVFFCFVFVFPHIKLTCLIQMLIAVRFLMHSQKVQPHTKAWQPKIFIFMALKGTFQMWPGTELSKDSGIMFFSTQWNRQTLTGGKKNTTTPLNDFLFSKQCVGVGEKEEKLSLNKRWSIKTQNKTKKLPCILSSTWP